MSIICFYLLSLMVSSLYHYRGWSDTADRVISDQSHALIEVNLRCERGISDACKMTLL